MCQFDVGGGWFGWWQVGDVGKVLECLLFVFVWQVYGLVGLMGFLVVECFGFVVVGFYWLVLGYGDFFEYQVQLLLCVVFYLESWLCGLGELFLGQFFFLLQCVVGIVVGVDEGEKFLIVDQILVGLKCCGGCFVVVKFVILVVDFWCVLVVVDVEMGGGNIDQGVLWCCVVVVVGFLGWVCLYIF